MTSSPALRASIVTEEITLLMPGAGPPPTRIARRGRVREAPLGDAAMLVILRSLPFTRVSVSLTQVKFTYVLLTLRFAHHAPASRSDGRGITVKTKRKGPASLPAPSPCRRCLCDVTWRS